MGWLLGLGLREPNLKPSALELVNISNPETCTCRIMPAQIPKEWHSTTTNITTTRTTSKPPAEKEETTRTRTTRNQRETTCETTCGDRETALGGVWIKFLQPKMPDSECRSNRAWGLRRFSSVPQVVTGENLCPKSQALDPKP